jgi:hypothetical protein
VASNLVDVKVKLLTRDPECAATGVNEVVSEVFVHFDDYGASRTGFDQDEMIAPDSVLGPA